MSDENISKADKSRIVRIENIDGIIAKLAFFAKLNHRLIEEHENVRRFPHSYLEGKLVQ